MPETDGALGVLCTDHCLTCRGVGKVGVGKGMGKACVLKCSYLCKVYRSPRDIIKMPTIPTHHPIHTKINLT